MNYIVKIRPTFDFDEALKVVSRFGSVYLVVPEILSIGLDTDSEAVANLRTYLAVEEVVPDKKISMSAIPSDPGWGAMWFAPAMGLVEAWDISTGVGVKVAVLDTGVNVGHADLADKLLPGWCVVTNTNTVAAVKSHGTSATSIVVGANNGVGMVGIAHGSMGIPIRITTDSSGDSSDIYVSAGIVKAVELGANVISISFSPTYSGSATRLAAKYARQKGVVVVCAMPNDLNDDLVNPAFVQDMITVGSVDSTFSRIYGNGGIMLVRAPQGVPAASGTGSAYSTFSGNSSATPVVAGVCALILSVRPDLGLADIREIFKLSSNRNIIRNSEPTYTELDGYGFVDALEALRLARKWVSIGAQSPKVIISKPLPNEAFFYGEQAQIEVIASDDIAASSVDLFYNNEKIETAYSPPFVFTLDTEALQLPLGVGKLKAVAYDNLGQDSPKAEIDIRIGAQAAPVGASVLEAALPEFLTEGRAYEVRARFTSALGVGPWSDWLDYTTPSAPPVAVSEYRVEKSSVGFLVYYTHPHAGQSLEFRLGDGDWSPVTTNPFVVPQQQGVASLELRTASAIGATEAIFVDTLNFNRIYYVVYEAGLPEPTSEQIMLGQNGLGEVARAFGNEEALSSDGICSFVSGATGLAPGTPYRIAFVGTDGARLSNVAVSDAWETLSSGTIVRSLVVEDGNLYQLPAGQETVGRKPIVIYQGTLKEQAWSEGDHVVVGADGALRCVADHETLVM